MARADTPADILIVGGGLTGSSLASALSNGVRRITVLEARPGRGPRFAGELIHPPGVDVLDENGLLGPLRAAGGTDVAGFAVFGAPGREATRLPYAEVRGAREHGFAIEHHDMVAALRAVAASRPGVTVRTGVRIVDVARDGERIVGVVTADGETIRGDLTLIAEGRHSKLRRRLGITESSRLVSYTAAVLVAAELPHGAFGHIILGAPGPILAYPIGPGPDGHKRPRVRMCLDLPSLPEGERSTSQVAALLRDRYAPTLPEPLRSGILASLAEHPPEIAANHSITTRRCVADGAALVGESGGCSHPLTASGMTVCLTDIRILVEELGRDVDRHEALANYQKRRYRFVRARETLADALYEVMRADTDATLALREGIFDYWDGGARARATSLALLSGHESRLSRFLVEYWRVASRGMGRTVRGAVPGPPPTLRSRWRGIRGLVGKSFEKLARVVDQVRA